MNGKKEFIHALECIRDILSPNGTMAILDHASPGTSEVEIRVNAQTLEQLRYFREHFVFREFTFEEIDQDHLRMTLRDVYEFMTKTWSFGGPLEEEEMNETHTPFTLTEFATLISKAGMMTDVLEGHLPMDNHPFEKIELPMRYIISRITKK